MEQQTGSHVNRCTKDFLKIRLRRMVKAVLAEQYPKASSGYFNFIREQHRPLISKVIWIGVFLICIALFTFQTYDRTLHYFSYPVSVHGFIRKRSLQTFPHLTVCQGNTKGYLEFLRKTPTDNGFWCSHHVVQSAVKNPGNFTMEEIWEMLNTTTAVISAKGITESSITPLDIETKSTVWGLCTTFSYRSSIPLPVDNGRYEIVLEKYSARCDNKNMNVYLHDESTTLTGHRHREILQGRRHNYAVSIAEKLSFVCSICNLTKSQSNIDCSLSLTLPHASPTHLLFASLGVEVSFVNRPQSPCISAEDHQECEENCFMAFLKERVECRLPCFPAKINLNRCNQSYDAAGSWTQGHNYIVGASAAKPPCTCTRKCHHRTIVESHSSSNKYDNQTVITLELPHPYETLIQERLSYGMVDLLSTIGGNSGLYIGTSLLSIVQFIIASLTLKKKKNLHKFTVDDPLFKKVLKTFKILNRSNNKGKSMITPQKQRSKTAFKFSAIVVVSTFCIVTVLIRIMYFFDYPSKISINITFKATLKFPELIICTGDPFVLSLQKWVAWKKNMSDFCEVKAWDLFDLPEILPSSYIMHYLNKIPSMIWENQALMPLHELNRNHIHSIPIFDGTCVKSNYAKKEVRSFQSEWYFEGNPLGHYTMCGTNYMKLYIKDSARRFDYLQYRYFVSGTMSKLTFVIKEILIDESINECNSERNYDICVDMCLTKKLLQDITCRLPYMHQYVELPLCNTSSSAKQSHLKFMEIYMVPPSVLKCGCLPKCLTRIYETRMENNPSDRSFLTVNAAYNVVESYKRVQTYSFVQLLCDIGGLLGFLLGLSVLTLFEIMITYFESLAKKTES